MRKPSRTMPPAPTRIGNGLGDLVLALGVAFAGLLCLFPVGLVLFGGIALVTLMAGIRNGRRLARLAEDRPGESICTFARSFDTRAVDTWVIRAVFEELQPYCRFGRRMLPLRAADSLDDLGVDPEDLDDLAGDIAYRAGRSLEETETNPRFGRVETVSDLVHFLVHQPRRGAA